MLHYAVVFLVIALIAAVLGVLLLGAAIVGGIYVFNRAADTISETFPSGLPTDLPSNFPSELPTEGLGAPIGSVLCGSNELIAKARRLRKMVGGGMRQAGLLAAAGLYALEHQVERLADDHANAAFLAKGLSELGYEVEPVQTNMVYVDIGDRAQALKAFAAERGIKLSAASRLRMVTHLDVSRAQIEQVLATFVEFSRK